MMVHTKEQYYFRILSTNDSVSSDNTNDNSSKVKLYSNQIQNTPLIGNSGYKSRLRLRSTSALVCKLRIKKL